jgi:hypothetical protein
LVFFNLRDEAKKDHVMPYINSIVSDQSLNALLEINKAVPEGMPPCAKKCRRYVADHGIGCVGDQLRYAPSNDFFTLSTTPKTKVLSAVSPVLSLLNAATDGLVRWSNKVFCALTALPALNAGREIFHVASGTYSRLVPQTPEKIAGQIAGQSLQKGGEVPISL